MALSFTPGQVVSWDDLNALMAQHGSPNGAKSVVKVERKPLTKEEREKIEDAGGDPDAPEQSPTYRYYFEDGSYVDAKADSQGTPDAQGRPTGTFQIVDYKPSQKYQQAQSQQAQNGTAKPPETKDEGGRRWQWQPNPGGPNAGGRWVDVGAAPETPAERSAREANAPSQSVATRTVNGQTYTVITIVPKPGQPGQPGQVVLGPDGQMVAGGVPGEAPKPTTRDITVGGRHYTQVVTAKPDGTVEVSYLGPDGKPIAELPQEGKTPYPADLPSFTFDWSNPAGDGGLIAYAQQIRSRPDLTDAQKAELIRDAHGAATSTISRATSVINAQEGIRTNATTQRQQDVSLANQRLSTSASNFGNALTAAQNATKYSPGPDAASVLPYYLAMAQAAGMAAGGYQTPPQVGNGPAIQQAGAMGLPGRGLPNLPSLINPFAASEVGQPGDPAGFTPAAPPTLASPQGQGLLATNEATRRAVMAEQDAAARPTQDAALQGASLGPIGPANWLPTPGAQPQPQAYQPSGMGALMMQRSMGGYDPTGLNQQLLAAGLDPEVLSMMGGVG